MMDLIRKNPVCSFEIDTAHKPVFIKDKKYATMNFESAMGRGKIEIIDNEQEKIRSDFAVNQKENVKITQKNCENKHESILKLEL